MARKTVKSTKKPPVKKAAPKKPARNTAVKKPASKTPAKKATAKTPTPKKKANSSHFKKGNEMWRLVKSPGKNKTFETPEAMWNEAVRYFEWCDNNPLHEEKVFGNGRRMTVSHRRAYTIAGLCFFLDISEETFRNYGTKQEYSAYFGVRGAIDQAMFSQKFEGAAVGLFKENIISRDLGLADRSESKNTNFNYNSDPLNPEKIKAIDKALEDEY